MVMNDVELYEVNVGKQSWLAYRANMLRIVGFYPFSSDSKIQTFGIQTPLHQILHMQMSS